MPAQPPTTLTHLGNLATTPLLQGLWAHFPENMFVIRVDEPEDFVIEAANPAQMATLGGQCEGQRILDVIPQPTADAVIAHYRRCIAQGSPIRYEEDVTYVDARGAERTGHWLTLLVPLRHNSDRITHLFGVSQDVSELRLARAALERQNQDLEARVQERTTALRQANAQLRALNSQLERLASHDSLTGIYNRRHLEELTQRELSRAERNDQPLALLMLDIDRFKTINDTAGHATGDNVLVRLVEVVTAELRTHDLLGRFGGDEFVLLLPDTTRGEAHEVGQRLRQAAAEGTGTTLSIGLVESRPGDRTLADLTTRADRLLLHAKHTGRDRIVTD